MIFERVSIYRKLTTFILITDDNIVLRIWPALHNALGLIQAIFRIQANFDSRHDKDTDF
jgi:hypothetical protein